MSKEIQRGKLVGQQGPGSIYVDTDGSSYIISSADKWFDREVKNAYIDSSKFEIHDSRLEKILKVNKFFEVPEYRTTFDKSRTSNTNLQIPISRFPLVEYCSKCGTFNTAKPGFSTKKRVCKNCQKKQNFIQFPIVVICKKGHISDFPYFFFIHTKKDRGDTCKRQWIERSGPSILNWTLRCDCGAAHSLTGVTGRSNDKGGSPFVNEMRGAKCYGKMPWTGDYSESICDSTPVAILKNSLNVYRPETIEALSITESKEPFNHEISFTELLNQEFERLNGSKEVDDDDKLKIRKSFSRYKNEVIKSITHVDRLQQLVIQTNFHREEPSDEIDSFDKATIGAHESLVFSKDYSQKNWYPAKKMYGEGLFIEFNSNTLREWEEKAEITNHYKLISKRVGDFYLQDRFFSPATILIHTLSHLLIRELSRHSGYPMTAIRERLYLDSDSQGLLLYVTDSDKSGTFGGLVRLADENIFKKILNRAINNGEWCSSDPVCHELGLTTGQGIQNSNGAACHNCSFVPSTSCGSRNCFLDREYLSRVDSELSITNYYDML